MKTFWFDYRLSRYLGLKHYELTDHLGNVNVAVLDKISGTGTGNSSEYAYLSANISSFNDYYPFGMPMPGRNGSLEKYRFGFNGQEKVNEIAGIGNHNTALYGEADSRIARRWNLDPKPNLSISPYALYANNPIWHNDILLDTPTSAAVTKAQSVRIASSMLILDNSNLNNYHKAAALIRKEYEFDKFGNFGNVKYVIEKNEGYSAFVYSPTLRTICFYSGNLDYISYKKSSLGVNKSFVMTTISLGHEHVHNFQQFVMGLNTDEQRPEREVLAVEFSLFPNDGYMRNEINEYVRGQGQNWDVEFDDRINNGLVDILKKYAQSNYNRLPNQALKDKYKHIIEKIQNRPYNEDAVK